MTVHFPFLEERDGAWAQITYRAKLIRDVLGALGPSEEYDRAHAAIRALPYGYFADEPCNKSPAP